jgi:hypothetical protein
MDVELWRREMRVDGDVSLQVELSVSMQVGAGAKNEWSVIEYHWN